MTAAGRKAAAYWAGWATKARNGFHQALGALAAASPEIAAITMNDIGASTAPFVVRPDETIGVYGPRPACFGSRDRGRAGRLWSPTPVAVQGVVVRV